MVIDFFIVYYLIFFVGDNYDVKKKGKKVCIKVLGVINKIVFISDELERYKGQNNYEFEVQKVINLFVFVFGFLIILMVVYIYQYCWM